MFWHIEASWAWGRLKVKFVILNTTGNLIVEFCFPWVKYERNHIHVKFTLLTCFPRQVLLAFLNLTTSGKAPPDSWKCYCQILFTTCSIRKKAHTCVNFVFSTCLRHSRYCTSCDSQSAVPCRYSLLQGVCVCVPVSVCFWLWNDISCLRDHWYLL